MNPVFPDLSSLSRAEKLQLIEDLWDEIAATPATLAVLNVQISPKPSCRDAIYRVFSRPIIYTKNP